MTTQPNEVQSREGTWAKPVDKLTAPGVPSGTFAMNVEGRRLTGPIKGFGQMWQKTYKVRLSGVTVTPAEVIRTWRENFSSFWPKGNKFYAPLTGIKPGEVAVLNLAGPGGVTAPGGLPIISTGVMFIYSDEESFSFMTPEGHVLAAMITFSAYDDGGVTVAQAQALIRANDPLYELAFRLGVGHKNEDDFWHHTLTALAAHFGLQGQVQQQVTLVDPKIQWSEAKNIWHNAAIRTVLGLPGQWVGNIFRRQKDGG